MMSGVAQVIGMKPIFRSFFSSAPLSCAIASSAPKGTRPEIAASAVDEPIADRNRLRVASSGNSARITADWITRLLSASGLLSSGTSRTASCSACDRCFPQGHAAPSRTSGLKGLLKADMSRPPEMFEMLPRTTASSVPTWHTMRLTQDLLVQQGVHVVRAAAMRAEEVRPPQLGALTAPRSHPLASPRVDLEDLQRHARNGVDENRSVDARTEGQELHGIGRSSGRIQKVADRSRVPLKKNAEVLRALERILRLLLVRDVVLGKQLHVLAGEP